MRPTIPSCPRREVAPDPARSLGKCVLSARTAVRCDLTSGGGDWGAGAVVGALAVGWASTDAGRVGGLVVVCAGGFRSARAEVVGLDDVVRCGDQLPFCLDGSESAS